MLVDNNKNFSKEELLEIWSKGNIVPNYDPAKFRKDRVGAWMSWSDYGQTDNELGLGWEVDHIVPLANGGADVSNNKRPLQWRNNRAKSDNYPEWISEIDSSENRNVYRKKRIIES